MGLLTYPRSIWTPQPYWARQRNAAGQRIRVDGARMNAEECCCGPTPLDGCTACADEIVAADVVVTLAGFSNGTDGAHCTGSYDCTLLNDSYPISITTNPGTGYCGQQEFYSLGDVTVCQGPTLGHNTVGLDYIQIDFAEILGVGYRLQVDVRIRTLNAGIGSDPAGCSYIFRYESDDPFDCTGNTYVLDYFSNSGIHGCAICSAAGATATVDL